MRVRGAEEDAFGASLQLVRDFAPPCFRDGRGQYAKVEADENKFAVFTVLEYEGTDFERVVDALVARGQFLLAKGVAEEGKLRSGG